ncbi:type VII secretion protein EccE [Prauserella marina]|uniref:Type VII secretion protein EccE n=1 Tax=Prauserella marina TaxID=530584 RepID=A0A222VJR1_9PSEU|nr:type VII secretion protein EccE [Prauserella marina]ASR34114.1 type VII secretion protein EccE [Prauserella marina]PWV82755.1 type VII secretion protein EccE [Prauserella marina]SDC76516.1 type VII secretion protein EccE [Prauserella marina]
MANVVVLEVGLAIGLLLLSINNSLLYVSIGIAAAAVVLAFLRWGGQWFTQWAGLTARYTFRPHQRVATPPAPAKLETLASEDRDNDVIGPDDARVRLLRLVVPDLVVAQGIDHEHQTVGLSWHDGTWTAVLLVEPMPALVTQAGGAPSLPLSALAPCLEDRGVVLDSIQMIWHCYPGSAALPTDSPALSSYLEVLGPLPAAARRTTWVTIKLDPRRCAAAVRERGGGVVGAHRALLGAMSRVRNALESRGVATRPLGPDELLRAGTSAAELTRVAGSPSRVGLRERWTGVTAAGIGHASYAITEWPKGEIASSLNVLTSVRALSATVAMSISPSEEDQRIGLRGVVRLSARTPHELDIADRRLTAISDRLGVALTPLQGMQAAGFAATLPLGGSA